MYRTFLVTVILVLTLVVSGYAAGGGEDSDAAADAEPLWHFNSFASPGFPAETEDNPVLQYMIEQSGVNVRIETASVDDFDTKLQLYAAAGTLPDFWHHNASIALNTAEWEAQGLIRPVGKLIEEYAPELFDFIPQTALDAVTIDGEIYAIPSGFNPDDPAGGYSISGLVLREDWLNNLGLSVPETLDELYEVMRAFTYDDPDGNGRDDTFGMGASNSLDSFTVIANAFGVHPFHWYEQNGQLVRGDLTERYIEALRVIRNWYEAGVIDPEFAAVDYASLQARVINSQIGSLGTHVWFPHPRWHVLPVLKKQVPDAALTMIPAVEGPYGDRGYGPGNALLQTVWISSRAENPERIMQLLSWLAAGTNHLVPRFGIQGVDWEYNETRTGFNWLSEPLQGDQNDRVAYGLGNAGRMWPVIDRTSWRPEIEASFEAIEAHLLDNEFIGAVPAMSQYTDIDSLLQEAFVLYIIGRSSIEDVRRAQEAWYAEGGNEITAQVNNR